MCVYIFEFFFSNNVLTICDCVGVPVLVSLLSYTNADPVLFYSINLIHTILLENKKSKVSFRLAGTGCI